MLVATDNGRKTLYDSGMVSSQPCLRTGFPALFPLTSRERNENIEFHHKVGGVDARKRRPNPQADAERLEAASDEAIAACGGNARDAVKALIVANEFLESEVCELMQAVSHAYARGRFKTYTG
jgi:hypothetical protein